MSGNPLVDVLLGRGRRVSRDDRWSDHQLADEAPLRVLQPDSGVREALLELDEAFVATRGLGLGDPDPTLPGRVPALVARLPPVLGP